MAAKLNGATGLRMQVHYLNTTLNELHAQVGVEAHEGRSVDGR